VVSCGLGIPLFRGVAEDRAWGMFNRVEEFVRDVRELAKKDDLAEAISVVTSDFGFRHFALAHHVDLRRSSSVIRIHNYPAGWAEWFDEQRLGAIERLYSERMQDPPT